MLETLHRIVQEVNAARDARDALRIMVSRVADMLEVNVCTIYLWDNKREQFVLTATKGLNEKAIGAVRLAMDEGLVGLVAEREEPINLEDSTKHPRYRYFRETGEEKFNAFLGVPVVHFRSVVGVLVVQQSERRRFSEDDVAFMMTMAAQVSSTIANFDFAFFDEDDKDIVRNVRGVPGSPGIAVGVGYALYPAADLNAVPDRGVEDVEREKEVFLAAVQYVQEELKKIGKKISSAVDGDDHILFDAYVNMLERGSLIDNTLAGIETGLWAPAALRNTVTSLVQQFQEMEDAYLRERGDDIRDLGQRILKVLQAAEVEEREIPDNAIIIGDEITASQLGELPLDKVKGLVSVRGSGTSHLSILARAMGLPAVLGVRDVKVQRLENRHLIVDGYGGQVYIDPTHNVLDEFERLSIEEAELTSELAELHGLPAQTPDGYRVTLYANTGLITDINSAADSDCEGVGLHRTEFPFMIRDRFPGEEEQTQWYRDVLGAFPDRPVTLRTLDIGGDKGLPYFVYKEDNPFLGWRGIRVTLDHPEIFLTQLRAMLRANAEYGNLRLLLPMVSRLSEVNEAKALLERAQYELLEEGVDVIMPSIGVMVEVPSAVFQIESIARKVDFLSVGTNDLTQYLLAVDRNNSHVASLYDELHPSVLMALKRIAEVGRMQRVHIGVCGNMAGDPAAAILLLAMGYDSLSMAVSSLGRVKWVMRSISKIDAESVLAQALMFDDSVAIRAFLNATLEDLGLGGLIRAGR